MTADKVGEVTLERDAQARAVAEIAEFEQALRESGPAVALERLVCLARDRNDDRALLDALLVKARHELGLPLAPPPRLAEIAEPDRTRYEERYVDALRHVGQSLLRNADIPRAWPYFRAIAEKEPVANALADARLSSGDERIGTYIDIALYQGANPQRGFELVLEHYGTCSSISAFEQLPSDEAVRGACAARLTRTLHDQLASNLRSEIARSGQAKPSDDAPIPALIAGRDWLFADEGYHIDTSHLSSVVRMSPLLTERRDQLLALELCEYGRRLSPRLRYDETPPFEKTYEDHAQFLKVLLNRDVEPALEHFREKLQKASESADNEAAASVAQVLVRLLANLNRWDEAIQVSALHLAGLPESMLGCPGLAELCQRAGRLDRLAEISRAQGELVQFAAAVLQQRDSA